MLHLIPNLTRSVLDTGVVISLLSKIADAANGPCGTALSHHEFDIETKGTFPLAPLGERAWTAAGVFTSRGRTGLRPPKGYRRTRKGLGFGPQAGEGVKNAWAY